VLKVSHPKPLELGRSHLKQAHLAGLRYAPNQGRTEPLPCSKGNIIFDHSAFGKDVRVLFYP